MEKVSISPSVPRETLNHQRSHAAAVAKSGRGQIERIVDEHLHQTKYICSPEYRLGMVDALCQCALGIKLFIRYKRGTARSHAYWAGLEHGWGLSFQVRKGDL